MKLTKAFAPMTLHIESEEDLEILQNTIRLAMEHINKKSGIFRRVSPGTDNRYEDLVYLSTLLRK